MKLVFFGACGLVVIAAAWLANSERPLDFTSEAGFSTSAEAGEVGPTVNRQVAAGSCPTAWCRSGVAGQGWLPVRLPGLAS